MKILVTVLLVTALLSLTLGGLMFGSPSWAVASSGGCSDSWDVDSGNPPLIGADAIRCAMYTSFWA